MNKIMFCVLLVSFSLMISASAGFVSAFPVPYPPSSQSVMYGSQSSGTFPVDINTSDDAYVQYKTTSNGMSYNSESWAPGFAGFGGIVTWSHTTIAGYNRYLFLGVSIERHITMNPDVVSATYDGIPLSFYYRYEWDDVVSTEVWTLANPSVGLKTMEVTISSALTRFIVLTSVLNGVDQSYPIRGNVSGQGDTQFVMANITTEPKDWVVVDLSVSPNIGATCTGEKNVKLRLGVGTGLAPNNVLGCKYTKTADASSEYIQIDIESTNSKWSYIIFSVIPSDGLLSVTYFWTNLPNGVVDLCVEAYVTNATIAVQAYRTTTTSWVSVLAIDGTTDTDTCYDWFLTSPYWDGGNPKIRFYFSGSIYISTYNMTWANLTVDTVYFQAAYDVERNILFPAYIFSFFGLLALMVIGAWFLKKRRGV